MSRPPAPPPRVARHRPGAARFPRAVRPAVPALSFALPLLALLLLALAGPARAENCPDTGDEADEIAPLPHLEAALSAKEPLAILVLGTGMPGVTQASPAGEPGAGGKQKPGAPTPVGFPFHAATVLQNAVPGLKVQVTLRNSRGSTAAAMLDVMRAELARHSFPLVVWETGTVEAVRNMPADDFYQALVDGAALATAAGADLVLVDPQYSHFLESFADISRYEEALQAAGALSGVTLFHRFDLMRGWAEAGVIDIERTPRAQRPAAIARLQACLGERFARLLLRDAGRP